VSELIPAPIASALESGLANSNLAFALFCLDPLRRRDMLTFYRFCRIVDDIADSAALSREIKRDSLDAWKAALNSQQLRQLPADLAELIQRLCLPVDLFEEIVTGVAMDLDQTRYQTFEDLRKYCWRVASAVGLVSISIFGCTQPASRIYATHLGLALQLTNILRDVREDAEAGRIYLPIEDLARFGVGEVSLLEGRAEAGFLDLMRFEAGRAREFYRQALAALDPADREVLLPAEIMRVIYQRLLLEMEHDGFRVFGRRYRIPKPRKLVMALAVWLATRLSLSPPN
jgi:phytoene synthase